MTYELRRSDKLVVSWDGDSGEDAAIRYVDARRVAGEDVTVVAWRKDRHGLVVGTPSSG